MNAGCYGIWGIIALVNLIAFFSMRADKRAATTRAGRKAGMRIPEHLFLVLAVLGGWPLGYLGMMVFRHKTAKLSFQLKFLAAAVLGTLVLYGWLTVLDC